MTDFLAEDDEEGGLGGLFTCEEYIEKAFKIGSMSQVLLASNMSSVCCFHHGFVCFSICSDSCAVCSM